MIHDNGGQGSHLGNYSNQSKPVLIPFVRKFRPRLIELTSFKPKLLIRFIRNKTCKNKQTSISCQNDTVEK